MDDPNSSISRVLNGPCPLELEQVPLNMLVGIFDATLCGGGVDRPMHLDHVRVHLLETCSDGIHVAIVEANVVVVVFGI